jgi:hypothetical protein
MNPTVPGNADTGGGIRRMRFFAIQSFGNLALCGIVLLPMLVSCSPSRDIPEAQVRALLQRGVEAAERKDTVAVRQMISEKYSDRQGQDKKAVEAILRYYFLRNESIYLFTRDRGISFPEPSHALAVVLVAMAGQPMAGADDVARLRADLYRFEIALVNENKEWKVIRVEWRQAELGDFL